MSVGLEPEKTLSVYLSTTESEWELMVKRKLVVKGVLGGTKTLLGCKIEDYDISINAIKKSVMARYLDDPNADEIKSPFREMPWLDEVLANILHNEYKRGLAITLDPSESESVGRVTATSAKKIGMFISGIAAKHWKTSHAMNEVYTKIPFLNDVHDQHPWIKPTLRCFVRCLQAEKLEWRLRRMSIVLILLACGIYFNSYQGGDYR